MKYGIGERIRIFRQYKSLKQSAFAKLIGVSPSTLSEVEHGKNNAPSTSLIIGFANAFNDLNIEWLLTEKGEMIKDDAEDTQSVDIKQIVELIEPMNNKQRHEVLKFITEKRHTYELENLVKQLTEQNNL
jgi:transcriptional regulator with XRE-family HTH domain